VEENNDRHFPDPSRPHYIEPQPDADRVEALKKRLYSRVEPLPRRRQVVLKPIRSEMRNDWGDQPELHQPPRQRKNIFLVVFGVAALFFVAAAIYAGVVWHSRSQGSDGENVTVEIVGPVSVKGGDPVAFDIVIANQNAVNMEFVDLTLDFPEGTKSGDLSRDVKHEVMSVGTIAPGQVVKKSVEVVLFGKEQSVQNIDAKIQYRLPGSVNIFRREKNFALTLTKSPLSAVATVNKEVTSGQVMTVKVDVTSNSESPIEDAMVKIDYPFGFEVLEEDGTSLGEEGLFDLGSFDPGEKKQVSVIGKMTGSDGDERTFKISTGVRGDSGTAFAAVFGTDLESVKITRPFLAAEMYIGESTEPVVAINPERGIRSFIVVRNNLDVAVENVEVDIKLEGDVLEKSDVNPNQGYYRSADNTLLWTKTTAKDLASIAPGGEVRLSFAFGIKDLADGTTVRRNPEIYTALTVRGNRVSETDVPEEVANTIERAIKVNSKVDVDTEVAYSVGEFDNTGPVPPEADTPTTYTVSYLISNTSNALADVVIEIPLPQGVSWGGAALPAGSNVTFDESNRILTWKAGDVPAGAGYSGPKKTLSLQLTLFPSVSQVGSEAVLTSPGEISLYDRFSGQTIVFKSDRGTTRLSDDPIFKNGYERVQP
jgi:hypothetical protein